MKTKLIALFCSCFLLLNVVDLLVPRSEAKVYDNVIRLHVLADDNSEEAQSIKLLVRDAILTECGELFEENHDMDSACKAVEGNLEKIERVANRVLAENRTDYNAKAQWGYESYPTRVYEDFTLPSGNYLSLRINLGKAQGNNWWCVLFPPLCTSASQATDFSSPEIAENDGDVFTEKKYVFRFKILELFW